MSVPHENKLPASARIKLRSALDALFAQGQWLNAFPLKAVYLILPGTASSAPLQMGVSVSKKNMAKAVDRNRVKRLMREAYRTRRHAAEAEAVKKQKQVLVFFIYAGKKPPAFPEICKAMENLLERLAHKINTAQ